MGIHGNPVRRWLLLTVFLCCLGAGAAKEKLTGVDGRRQGSVFINNAYYLERHGTRKKSAGRVIGGREAGKTEFPFVVSIQLYRDRSWMHHCGGSIISPTAILTACHCVVVGENWDPPEFLNPGIARVVAGVVDLDEESNEKQVKPVEKLVAHPKCGNKPYYLSYDVGAYILEEPLRFTPSVQPLKLMSFCSDDAVRALSTLAKRRSACFSPGWGTTRNPGYYPSNVLKVATLYLFTMRQCQRFFCERTKHYCDLDYYDAKQICAAGPDSSDCNGDSGGPLVCDGYVFGTVSWRIRCEFGWPHVFANVVPILDIVKKYTSGYYANESRSTWHDPSGWYRRSGWNWRTQVPRLWPSMTI